MKANAATEGEGSDMLPRWWWKICRTKV